jgi:hypothetical protein
MSQIMEPDRRQAGLINQGPEPASDHSDTTVTHPSPKTPKTPNAEVVEPGRPLTGQPSKTPW